MTPLPKRRHSTRRGGTRESVNLRKNIPIASVCPKCNAVKLPHRACPKCGFYK